MKVCTQGRQNSDQWVTKYYVTYSRDGQTFYPYREGRATKVIEGERENFSTGAMTHHVSGKTHSGARASGSHKNLRVCLCKLLLG